MSYVTLSKRVKLIFDLKKKCLKKLKTSFHNIRKGQMKFLNEGYIKKSRTFCMLENCVNAYTFKLYCYFDYI